MNVQELREALSDLPAHWPVHVAVHADGSGGGADTDYLYTLDVQRDNFPTQGCMAVIRIDYGGRTTDEEIAAFRRGPLGVTAGEFEPENATATSPKEGQTSAP